MIKMKAKILRDEYYRCRLCEKQAHKELNSYILKLTPKIHIRVCRKCWLTVNRYNSLLKKIKNEGIK